MPSLKHVPIAALPIERYQPLLRDQWPAVEAGVRRAREIFAGRVIWHVNSTARGGGVAEMLRSLLAYARGVGADVRWLTIDGDLDFFRVTKRLHNHLHDAPGDGGSFGPIEREIYERTLLESASELVNLVRKGDIVYIHDPQPAGLVPHIQAADVSVVWRCHVGVDRPGELARGAWDFLRPYVSEADAYAFSREDFIWDGLDRGRVWIVPPSIDVFSPKNQELDAKAIRSILATIGVENGDRFSPALFQRFDGSQARVDRPAELDQDQPIPPDAPLVTQVSRWDGLKDPVGVLRCFAEHLDSADAHLLLAGPAVEGIADDPEGVEVLAETRACRDGLPTELRARIHLASLPMDDVEENAAMVNAIQGRSGVVVQKSLAEGFGLTVAEAMWKSKPVVASKVGGIQDQVVDGESGLLIDDPLDLEGFGAAIQGLLADPARARRVGDTAREQVRNHFLGDRHLIQYLELLDALMSK